MTLNHAFLSALGIHPFHQQVGFPKKCSYMLYSLSSCTQENWPPALSWGSELLQGRSFQ